MDHVTRRSSDASRPPGPPHRPHPSQPGRRRDELEELRRENARLRRERDDARRGRDRALGDLEAEARRSARLRRERDDAERDLDREVREGDRLRRRDRDRDRDRDARARESARLPDGRGRQARPGKDAARWPRGPQVVAVADKDSSVEGEEWDAWYDDVRRYAHEQDDDGSEELGCGSDSTAVGRWEPGDDSDGIDSGNDEGPGDGGDAVEEQSNDWMDEGWFAELLAGDA